MEKKIMAFAQDQLGSANLEAKTVGGLFKSFFGKVLQWMAMTRFPIGAKNRCRLERLRGVKIGKHVFLGGGNILDRVRPDLITIEDDVSLAGGVYILTHSNPTAPLRAILGESSHVVKPVHIKKGAWIAINVVILPGVTIGENSIVSAGSVVRKNVPPYTIVGGTPAVVLKTITPIQQLEK
ncbi:acyltransferase [Larkinella punicea]|uniref:Acyltransferase n=1 Tax=Larkinella punicea TaxID=2315727 RepID=A0A368JIX8_9BACT|nr:acyltransferase [Larkinella punicea]RCR67609.1 acyltransferase [Larkinella punicea]